VQHWFSSLVSALESGDLRTARILTEDGHVREALLRRRVSEELAARTEHVSARIRLALDAGDPVDTARLRRIITTIWDVETPDWDVTDGGPDAE
jgi:hypothetical protein